MLRRGVLGSVDDAKVFSAPALHRRLHQPASGLRNELERLHDHPLSPGRGKFFPPINALFSARLVPQIDYLVWSRDGKQSGHFRLAASKRERKSTVGRCGLAGHQQVISAEVAGSH
jgi:hypothetical protein